MQKLPNIRFRVAGGLALALVLGLGGTSFAHGAPNPSCANPTQQAPDLIAARAALQHSPDLVAKRLALVDLLLKAECYDDAVHVLEDGQQLAPRNTTLQNRLTQARSMLREQAYFAGLDDAEASARLSRSAIRCTKLGEISACDELLARQPSNVEAILAKGDALTKANKINEAMALYAHANETLPGNALIGGRLETLQSQRKELIRTCTSGDGETALQACSATLVPGAANEFDLTVRIAILQQSNNQASKALDSYIAANTLRHGDKSVALATLALLDSTQRKDAVALAARGSSLMTLGRPGEALVPLRQAAALAPTLPGIGAELAAAQAQARKQAARVAATPSPAAKGSEPHSYSNTAPASLSN
jgi:tetratricopeptide (TPR) repeat protein